MKVLVFELNSFHLEVLPTYPALMPSLFGDRLDIDYFVLPALVKRARAAIGANVHRLNSPHLRYVLPTKPLRVGYYRWRIQRIIDQLCPDAIVFNTVEPPPYFRVFQQLDHPLKIGIVHNPRRDGADFLSRGSVELIFCLHDYNYRSLQEDGLVDGYVSPFFKFLEVPQEPTPTAHVEIVVQGVISFSRRDYAMLIDVADRLRKASPSPRVVFNILGDADIRDGPMLKRMVAERGLHDSSRFHSWLPDKEFFQALQGAHYVMPLLNPASGAYAGTSKVTNAFGHSGAYSTPLLLHRETATQWSVPQSACVTYASPGELETVLAHGVDDYAARASAYRTLIAGKISENHRMLREMARRHPVFAAVQRRPAAKSTLT